jgi:3D-(3,5/4)-trihydroxycyclohexane-1,2-dione acylhydrolase (decyclizing)
MPELTVAQALVRFLSQQEVERDGVRSRFIAGCFGIFGHGNVAGIGQALHQYSELLPFYAARNEQSMVHVAAAYARQRNRLATFACTTSVGPGATNMVTAAAGATINRLPVLLLPGDVFATRGPAPVLQQLELSGDPTASVNDCLRPVSRFFERVERPEQLVPAALEAMRVLTDPAMTGAVTLALPQDVQAQSFVAPDAFLAPRVWVVPRQPPAPETLDAVITAIKRAKRPLLVAGGGMIYSDALAALRELVDATGIPVAETQAGRGSLISEHPLSLGAIGATGTRPANEAAQIADLVIGVGTRWSDFTTASHTVFQDADVAFVNINVNAADAAKLGGIAAVGDARVTLDALRGALGAWQADPDWSDRATVGSSQWASEVSTLVSPRSGRGLPTQAEVIGAVNDAAADTGVVVCAAGSAPGDLHKLWRARDPAGKSYHVEYGYSCMGYEIPGGIGVKLAAPERQVFVIVGDGSYLMSPGELVTAVALKLQIVIVLIDNGGYASIGALSRSVGSRGFGTHARRPIGSGLVLDTSDPAGLDRESGSEPLPVDLAANAESLGAHVVRVDSIAALRQALATTDAIDGPVVLRIATDRYAGVPNYGAWWDVPVAEISEQATVRSARTDYELSLQNRRAYL